MVDIKNFSPKWKIEFENIDLNGYPKIPRKD